MMSCHGSVMTTQTHPWKDPTTMVNDRPTGPEYRS